ncbi:phosphogluconate dehydrogenase (NAD(+)-dependent, decarboxylating) [Terriglobus saanensis]|uniref:6-phosphogluconate dehydrogenase, decarboxylating n=1 Tax=Terriglobus saanensis (strain ATCC BAA-1853 / DSM 23119 / SP1PR4) TaxID=401053 RepID=E8V742_TERSS|nr:decarboxylating 6-phosphogluconate dehydrogenase [Terriglobus saanensis]ADV81682.1 6-phosphogluconate dehydrogenase, decarboxylating [Terriglobus saanensis SP1PR4]
MQIAMIGLGRMGANMVRRLMKAGHECVVYNRSPAAVDALVKEGATGSTSIKELVSKLKAPRAVWMMVPAGAVDATIQELQQSLEAGDIVIDGGNSYYVDDLRRSKAVGDAKLKWADVGTSGGVFGLERGYCLMIGGEKETVQYLDPIFKALAPGRGTVDRTPGRENATETTTAEEGYLHCGPAGAGHFVKMVHNGIEYGIMAAYAEGLNILKHANVGNTQETFDAETAPMREPDHYKYDMPVPEIAEVWRRGSVVSSWLLDLTAAALVESPELKDFSGRVSDSGEGRWTTIAAIDEGVPADVLSAALFARFTSQSNAVYANKLLSAMRFQFGGHKEKTS